MSSVEFARKQSVRERRGGVRTASMFLTVVLGSGALTACNPGGGGEAAPRSSTSASTSANTEASTSTETTPPFTDPEHPYAAMSGTIINTEGVNGRPQGTWAYSGPRERASDQTKVIRGVLPQGATVQKLCRIALGRKINLDVQSSPEVIGKLGHERTDWVLLQGPLPDTIAKPEVTAGDPNAGGWIPAGFVTDGPSLPKCLNV